MRCFFAAAAFRTRTVSRRISRCCRIGLIHRAVVAPSLRQPPERDREPAQRPQAHLLHEQAEQRGRELPSEHQCLPGQARREVVKRVAGGENDPADAGGAVADEQLNERAARVVADDGGAPQVETVEKLGHEPRDPAKRQVCVGVHRVAMRPQRQRRRHASVIDGEAGDHIIPEGGVHQEPVQQHERRSFAARVLVFDRPG
jgi:hypothetical protein